MRQKFHRGPKSATLKPPESCSWIRPAFAVIFSWLCHAFTRNLFHGNAIPKKHIAWYSWLFYPISKWAKLYNVPLPCLEIAKGFCCMGRELVWFQVHHGKRNWNEKEGWLHVCILQIQRLQSDEINSWKEMKGNKRAPFCIFLSNWGTSDLMFEQKHCWNRADPELVGSWNGRRTAMTSKASSSVRSSACGANVANDLCEKSRSRCGNLRIWYIVYI